MLRTIQGFTTVRPSGDDSNPICPRCGHYNAMLGTGRYLPGVLRIEILECRDCHQQAVLAPAETPNPNAGKVVQPDAEQREKRRKQLVDRLERYTEKAAGALALEPRDADQLNYFIRCAATNQDFADSLDGAIRTQALLLEEG